MTDPRTLVRSLGRCLGVVALAVALSGCISLFPKSKPVQLYRFGVSEAAAPAAGPVRASVTRAPTGFPRAAAADRILTVQGSETAYIAEARWVAPAALMFDDAVERAFDRHPGGPRLITRGDVMTSDLSLRLDVDTFEARYLDGKDAAPTVVVALRASVVRIRDRSVLGEKVFEARERATSNRVGSIVDAYDQAVKTVLDGVTDWTAATVG